MTTHPPAPNAVGSLLGWKSRSFHYEKPAESGQPFNLAPLQKFRQRVRADQKKEIRVWPTLMELGERVHGIRQSAATEFEIVGDKVAIPARGETDHLKAVSALREIFRSLMRRKGAGNKQNPIQFLLLHRILCEEQVAEMDWVERAAQDTGSVFHTRISYDSEKARARIYFPGECQITRRKIHRDPIREVGESDVDVDSTTYSHRRSCRLTANRQEIQPSFMRGPRYSAPHSLRRTNPYSPPLQATLSLNTVGEHTQCE